MLDMMAVCWDIGCVWMGMRLLLNVDDCKIMREAMVVLPKRREEQRRDDNSWILLYSLCNLYTRHLRYRHDQHIVASTPRYLISPVREQNSHTRYSISDTASPTGSSR